MEEIDWAVWELTIYYFDWNQYYFAKQNNIWILRI